MTYIPDQFGPNKWNRLFGFKLGEEARNEIIDIVREFHEDAIVTVEDLAGEDEIVTDEGLVGEDYGDLDFEDFADEATVDKATVDKSKFENVIDHFLINIERRVDDYIYMTRGDGVDFNNIDKTRTYTYLDKLCKAINKLELLIGELDTEKNTDLKRYMRRRCFDKRPSSLTLEEQWEQYPPHIIQKHLPNLKLELKNIYAEAKKRGGNKELDIDRQKGGRPSSASYGFGMAVKTSNNSHVLNL
jgi:hypothetical protein